MNTISKKIILFISLILAIIALPFLVFDSRTDNVSNINSIQNDNSNYELDNNFDNSLLGSDVDLQNDNLNFYDDDTKNENQIKDEDQNQIKDENAIQNTNNKDTNKTYNIRMIFTETNIAGCESFTNEEMQRYINITSSFDDNDDIYSVKEYFRDITFGRVNLEFSYGTRMYDDNDSNFHNKFYYNYIFDVTINCYPVKAENKDSKFWPRCATSSIVLDKDAVMGTICHELIHTFSVHDYYSDIFGLDNLKTFVGGWDIMSFDKYSVPPFPTVDTISHITKLTSSYYYDNTKTNIEMLNSSATVSLKATSYASDEDTIAIKISAKDLGYSGDYYNNIYFMIEYRKSNGIKDKNNPYLGDCLIVYRMNDNVYSNINATNQEQTQMYVFRKYNSDTVSNAGIVEGESFGFKSNQSYNTIFMPNGDNTGIVINNIKFNSNNECVFDVTLPNNNDNITVSGRLNSALGAVQQCKIYANDVLVGSTDSNGFFYLTTTKDANLKFVKDDETIKTFIAEKSIHNLYLFTDNNACNIVLKNNISTTFFMINEQAYQIDSTNFEIILNIGDKVAITSYGYSTYEFIYSGQRKLEIYLSESNYDENVFNRAVNNITNNTEKLKDSVVNIISYFGELFRNLPF